MTPAFGTRPDSGALSYSGNCPSVIENRTFRDLGANVIAIRLANCANVTIRDVDFINVSEGVYAVDSSNIRIERARYQNITGPYERVGLNRGNLVQFNDVQGGYVGHSRGRCGDTEDIVSVFASSNVVVEHNHFEGAYTSSPGCLAWRSSSGSGIALGDIGGSGNVARHNVLVNVGQVGAFIAGGTNSRIEDNIIIGEQRQSPGSNVGIYVEEYPSVAAPCTGHVVSGNRVHFRNAAGTLNGFWQGSRCTATVTGNAFSDTTLRADDYRVVLP